MYSSFIIISAKEINYFFCKKVLQHDVHIFALLFFCSSVEAYLEPYKYWALAQPCRYPTGGVMNQVRFIPQHVHMRRERGHEDEKYIQSLKIKDGHKVPKKGEYWLGGNIK